MTVTKDKESSTCVDMETKTTSENNMMARTGYEMEKFNGHHHDSKKMIKSEDIVRSMSTSFSPKIYIFGFILLLAAFVTQAVVLYRLNIEVDGMKQKMKGLERSLMQEPEMDTSEPHVKVSSDEGAISAIYDQENKLYGQQNQISEQQSVNNKVIRCKNNSGIIEELQKAIQNLTSKLNRQEMNLAKVKVFAEVKIHELQKLRQNSSCLDIRNYVQQLRLLQQLERGLGRKLNFNFNDVIRMSGLKDLITPIHPILKKLIKQMENFEKSNKHLNIEYSDLLRLTHASDFELEQLPVLGKIEKIYIAYEKYFKRKWHLQFKDIIRLTNRSQLEDGECLKLLQHLLEVFSCDYNTRWLISFADLIQVTENLNFTLETRDIAVLKMVDSWCPDNFHDIWGTNFQSLFHLLARMSSQKRQTVVERLYRIEKRNALNFLPGVFDLSSYYGLSVSGYIKILVKGVWGTIYRNNLNRYAVKVVCRHGGYSSGEDLRSYSQTETFGRSQEKCLIKSLSCSGNESNVTQCVISLDGRWTHEYDLAVKCYF